MMGASVISYWAGGMARASWQGGLALGLAWIAVRLLPGLTPRARCWLWRLAYLKLFAALLPLPPIYLPAPPLSAQTFPAPVQAPPVVPALFGGALSSAGPAAYHAVLATREHLLSPAALPFLASLLAAWLAGAAWAGLRTAGEWRAANRLKRRCEAVRDERLLEAMEDLCRRLRVRRPALLLLEGDGSSLLLGGIAPAILLPAGLSDTCSTAEIRLMLAHELAHLKRNDLLWGWLPAVAHGLFLFHPLVRIASREWRVAQEMACDELSIHLTNAHVGEYGTALLKVAAQCRPTAPPGLAAIGADEFPHILKRRLKAMKSTKPISPRRAIVMGAALTALGAATLVPWKVVASDAPNPTAADQQKKAAASDGTPQDLLAAVNEKVGATIKEIQSLGLSDDQNARLEAVFGDARTRIQAIFGNGSLPNDQRFIQVKQAMGEALEQVNGILTADQQKRFAEMNSKGVFKGGPAQSLLEEIERANKAVMGFDLTDAQKSQLQPIFGAARLQVQKILADESLPDKEKTNRAIAAIGPVKNQVQAILTPDQWKKLNALMSEGKGMDGGRSPVDGLVSAVIDGNANGVAKFIQVAGLPADRQVQLQSMFQAAHAQVQGFLSDSTIPNDQKKAKVGTALRAFAAQVETLMTPEQWKKLSGAASEAVGPFAWDAKLAMSLGPTDDQAGRLKQIYAEWEQKVQAATHDASLSEAQKQTAMKEADLWADQQIRGILTADQNRQLAELKQRIADQKQHLLIKPAP